MKDKLEFLQLLLPHAVDAIGVQHGWLVRWALAKAAQECGWNAKNALIARGNNCLGIKAGVQTDDGSWALFPGVTPIWLAATTGPEIGKMIPWRAFPLGLTQCFAELVRMWNDRAPYCPWRNQTVQSFEEIYADGTPGHSLDVLTNMHDIEVQLYGSGMVDERGRIVVPVAAPHMERSA